MNWRLKLHRCNQCLRRGRHELLADDTLAAYYCAKHAAALAEAMAPVANKIVVEYENGMRVTYSDRDTSGIGEEG